MEREEFSFPSSWPAAATAAPPVLRTLSPPLRTTADVEQSESETVDEVENSDQDVNESTHFTRVSNDCCLCAWAGGCPDLIRP